MKLLKRRNKKSTDTDLYIYIYNNTDHSDTPKINDFSDEVDSNSRDSFVTSVTSVTKKFGEVCQPYHAALRGEKLWLFLTPCESTPYRCKSFDISNG